MVTFGTKDSGARAAFGSGMVRDTPDGKVDYLLTRDGPMYRRWAELLDRGARKYNARNWMLADGPDELARFLASATRHFEQWLAGEEDEDHAAAVMFNLNGAEYVLTKMADRGIDRDAALATARAARPVATTVTLAAPGVDPATIKKLAEQVGDEIMRAESRTQMSARLASPFNVRRIPDFPL